MKEKIKVFRNVLLKGVISKETAETTLSLLSKGGWMEKEVIIKHRGKDIIIYHDDMNNICIDLYDAELAEPVGGEFESI